MNRQSTFERFCGNDDCQYRKMLEVHGAPNTIRNLDNSPRNCDEWKTLAQEVLDIDPDCGLAVMGVGMLVKSKDLRANPEVTHA